MNDRALLFQKNLYVLIKNGCTLQESIKAIAQNCKDKHIKQTAHAIDTIMNQGISFFDSINFTKKDRTMWKHLILIGNKTGNLQHSLEISIDALGSQKNQIQSLTQTLIYPLIVIFLLSLVIVLLLFFGIPILKESGLENIITIEEEIYQSIYESMCILLFGGMLLFSSVFVILKNIHTNASFWNIVSTLVTNICSYNDAISIASDLYGKKPLHIIKDGVCQTIFSSSITTGEIDTSIKSIAEYCIEKRNTVSNYLLPITESCALVITGMIVLRICFAFFLPLINLGMRYE